MNNKTFYTLLSLTVLAAIPATAQKKVAHQSMLWLRYAGKYQVSSEWTLGLELEDRRFAFPDRQQYWILPKISASRKLGSGWSASLGFIYYLNSSPSNPKESVAIAVPELRPFQEADYKQTIRKLKISHRFLLEERFKRKNDGEHLRSGYGFYFRTRYRLQLQYPLTRSDKLKLKVYDEILLNFGHSIVYNTFDQNRIYAGLNYALSGQTQIEAGYLNWFQQKSKGDQYLARDILRLTFYHTLKTY